MRLVNPLPESRHALERRLRAQLSQVACTSPTSAAHRRSALSEAQFRKFEQRERTFKGCPTCVGQIQRLIEVFVSLVESSSL